MPTESKLTAQTPQWEYRIVTSKDGLSILLESSGEEGVEDLLLDTYMTRIGALGWELVTAYRTDLGQNFVFKRALPALPNELDEPA